MVWCAPSLHYVHAGCLMHVFYTFDKIVQHCNYKIHLWTAIPELSPSILNWVYPEGRGRLKYTDLPQYMLRHKLPVGDINQIWLCRDGWLAPPLHPPHTHTQSPYMEGVWHLQSRQDPDVASSAWGAAVQRREGIYPLGGHLQGQHRSPPHHVRRGCRSRALRTHGHSGTDPSSLSLSKQILLRRYRAWRISTWLIRCASKPHSALWMFLEPSSYEPPGFLAFSLPAPLQAEKWRQLSSKEKAEDRGEFRNLFCFFSPAPSFSSLFLRFKQQILFLLSS